MVLLLQGECYDKTVIRHSTLLRLDINQLIPIWAQHLYVLLMSAHHRVQLKAPSEFKSSADTLFLFLASRV